MSILTNTVNHGIVVPSETLVGFMCPVTDMTPLATNVVIHDEHSLVDARRALSVVLKSAFDQSQPNLFAPKMYTEVVCPQVTFPF